MLLLRPQGFSNNENHSTLICISPGFLKPHVDEEGHVHFTHFASLTHLHIFFFLIGWVGSE
jgi:hypothetical protein